MPTLADIMSGAIKSGLATSQAGVSPSSRGPTNLDEMLKLAQFQALQQERGIKHQEHADVQKQKEDVQTQKQATDYSKRIEKMNDFIQSGQDLDKVTNRDGKGGILTNPDAHFSFMPTVGGVTIPQASGLKALVDPQAAVEKKAFDRYMLNYTQQMGGVRAVASPKAAQMERQALGWANTGDPDLMEKAVRSLALTAKSKIQTIQAGTSKSALDAAHASMGDPLDAFSQVYEDKPAPLTDKASSTAPKSPATPPTTKSNSKAGPHGPSVMQNGVQYNWNPDSGNYE